MNTELFTDYFCRKVRSLVERHHTIYPWVPPQGIFFEALVQQAFKLSGWTEAQVVPTSPNSPKHDLLVGDQRLSIKTETGKGTRPREIMITKLCTTERDPWTPEALIQHTMSHLARYDRMLMLRAIWREERIHYQLLEIPMDVLRSIETVDLSSVGWRKGRRSLGGDLWDRGDRVFHVHFDGADGKCQVRNLRVDRCRMLLEWDQPIIT